MKSGMTSLAGLLLGYTVRAAMEPAHEERDDTVYLDFLLDLVGRRNGARS